MFEHESANVRLGIEFLSTLLEKDFRQDPTFTPEKLQHDLNEVQADVDTLIATLPFEAVDDADDREREFPGDFEDSAELEDEIVECEHLIAQALKVIAAVKAKYLSGSASPASSAPAPSKPSRNTSATSYAYYRAFRQDLEERYFKNAPPDEYSRPINWSNVIIIALGAVVILIIYLFRR